MTNAIYQEEQWKLANKQAWWQLGACNLVIQFQNRLKPAFLGGVKMCICKLPQT